MARAIESVETTRGKVEISRDGTGSPILYLHGSCSNCHDDMGHKPLIEAGYSIITPSRPGYGNTPMNSGRTAEEAAALLKELLDVLKIESVVVIAASFGGPTALWLASKYPDKVKKLVLSSAVSKPISEETERYKSAKLFYGKGHRFMWGMLNITGRLSKRSLVKKTYQLFSTCDTREIMREIAGEDMDAVVRFYQKRPENIGSLNDLEHTIPQEVLGNIKVPTLIVHSKEDRAVPFSHAEKSKQMIKDSELFVAQTWGHFIWIGKGSAEVNDRVIRFLAQN